jgi:hypothetical protein
MDKQAKQANIYRTDTAHRGYLIRYSALSNMWWIEKDKTVIAYCTSLEDGKAQVNHLID